MEDRESRPDPRDSFPRARMRFHSADGNPGPFSDESGPASVGVPDPENEKNASRRVSRVSRVFPCTDQTLPTPPTPREVLPFSGSDPVSRIGFVPPAHVPRDRRRAPSGPRETPERRHFPAAPGRARCRSSIPWCSLSLIPCRTSPAPSAGWRGVRNSLRPVSTLPTIRAKGGPISAGGFPRTADPARSQAFRHSHRSTQCYNFVG